MNTAYQTNLPSGLGHFGFSREANVHATYYPPSPTVIMTVLETSIGFNWQALLIPPLMSQTVVHVACIEYIGEINASQVFCLIHL